MKKGQKVITPHGIGTYIEKEYFGNRDCDYRIWVRHDIFPENFTKGLFKDDILYYIIDEVKKIN